MALFEVMLVLALASVVLLQFARTLAVPYPTMLAAGGVAVAALPWAPAVSIDPHLALALFIAPALLDAAYDFSPRDVRRYWFPLLAMAAGAVILTTGAVAWAGVALAGLPIGAAIALGAIVAPPDAAAAAAMLRQLPLPRRTAAVLQGESLFNDAVSLLIFGAAVVGTMQGFEGHVPQLVAAVPGGLLLGYVLAKLYMLLAPSLAGTLGGTIFEFAATFSAWVLAERLHLSAILCVVALGMTLAHNVPRIQSANDRVRSYAVWTVAVFLLNVLAFVLMGLQAREIVSRLAGSTLSESLQFAGIVLAIVIGTRILWVMSYNRVVNLPAFANVIGGKPPTLAQGIVVSWCGMRGLVTLATALALPAAFPGRDVIVLSAFVTVIGTLVMQGLTLKPLIAWLRFPADRSFAEELGHARAELLDVAIAGLADHEGAAAERLRHSYHAERGASLHGLDPRQASDDDGLRRAAIARMRTRLLDMRGHGAIADEVFHALVQELDWAELAATPSERLQVLEG